MLAALRRWLARRHADRPLSPVEQLSAAMRQQMQVAELERYRFQRRRERTGNPIEETVFPPRHWNGEPT